MLTAADKNRVIPNLYAVQQLFYMMGAVAF
jgi:hypothetical protein